MSAFVWLALSGGCPASRVHFEILLVSVYLFTQTNFTKGETCCFDRPVLSSSPAALTHLSVYLLTLSKWITAILRTIRSVLDDYNQTQSSISAFFPKVFAVFSVNFHIDYEGNNNCVLLRRDTAGEERKSNLNDINLTLLQFITDMNMRKKCVRSFLVKITNFTCQNFHNCM